MDANTLLASLLTCYKIWKQCQRRRRQHTVKPLGNVWLRGIQTVRRRGKLQDRHYLYLSLTSHTHPGEKKTMKYVIKAKKRKSFAVLK